MRTYLALSWNASMAMGEFSAAAFFIFCILLLGHLTRRGVMPSSAWTAPLFIALSILVAAVLGWIVGSAMSSPGYGLGLIVPLAAILQAVHYNRYAALAFLIGFQLLGTLLGFGAFYLMRLALPVSGKYEPLVSPVRLAYGKTLAKSVVLQPVLIAALLLIPNLDITAYDSGLVLNALILALTLGLIIFLSQYASYIVISPLIGLVLWAQSYFEKTLTRQRVVNDLIEISTQLVVAMPIVAADVLVRVSRRVY